jgi:hypothetical protein
MTDFEAGGVCPTQRGGRGMYEGREGLQLQLKAATR